MHAGLMTLIDGYKLDHRRQYPPGTTRVYSNWTARSSRLPGQQGAVLFGLQYFLLHYLSGLGGEFFAERRAQVEADYRRMLLQYVGQPAADSIGTSHVAALHELGYLPLEIRALPEGAFVPLRVPMLTVENTHPDFFWLTNYFETLLSSVLWKPCVSATQARLLRRQLDAAARRTGTDPAFVPWQGHDFSMRGMSNPADAALSGAAHLLFFKGTDTVPALELVERYYGSSTAEPPIAELLPVGGSVPATEHSVMCAGGAEDEEATFRRLLDLYPSGIVSVVSDTWDLWRVLTQVLPRLKDRILARDGKLVIRPDSGDPVRIVAGNPFVPEGSPARRGVVGLLWDVFGGTTNAAGFRELDPHVGVIYGDAITLTRAAGICDSLADHGFASGNCVFGVGSYTYQYVTRDTLGFALKATWAEVAGQGRELWKAPVTDDGEKKSARGRLAVTRDRNRRLTLIEQASPADESTSLLRPVWRDGFCVERRTEFTRIRRRVEDELLTE